LIVDESVSPVIGILFAKVRRVDHEVTLGTSAIVTTQRSPQVCDRA
jgi:hypothetical protein